MRRMRMTVAALALAITGVVTLPGAADAATWGAAYYVHWNNGTWWGTVQDTKTDGHCVSLWTVSRSTGARQRQLARSCGGRVVGGAPGNGTEIVRMFRDDGRYQTAVW